MREHRYHSSLHTSSSLSTSFKPADLAASLETAAASPGLAAGGGAGAGAAGARAGAADAGAGAGAGASAAGAGAAGAAAAGSGSPAIPRASVAGLAAAGFTGVGGTSFDPPHPIGRRARRGGPSLGGIELTGCCSGALLLSRHYYCRHRLRGPRIGLKPPGLRASTTPLSARRPSRSRAAATTRTPRNVASRVRARSMKGRPAAPKAICPASEV